MNHDILDKVAPVRKRLQQNQALCWASRGLLAGGVTGIVLAVVHWLAETCGLHVVNPVAVKLAVMIAATLVFAGKGLMCSIDAQTAARAIDRRYALKDRTLTALSCDDAGAHPIRQIQFDDAQRHLRDIEPEDVVPFELPRGVFKHALLFLAGALACLVSTPRADHVTLAQPALAHHSTESPQAAAVTPSMATSGLDRVSKYVPLPRQDIPPDVLLDQRAVIVRYFRRP